MLDELLVYRDYDLIIVLNEKHVSDRRSKKGREILFEQTKPVRKKHKKERNH